MSKGKDKGKKSVSDLAASPVTTVPISYFRANSLYHACAEQIASDIALEIIENACTQVRSNYLDRIACPYAVQNLSSQVLELVQMIFIRRDNGNETKEDLRSWEADEEPAPVEIDTLAKGAIPIRYIEPPPRPDSIKDVSVSRVTSAAGSSRRGPRVQKDKDEKKDERPAAKDEAANVAATTPVVKPPSQRQAVRPREKSIVDDGKQAVDPKVLTSKALAEQKKREAEEAERVQKMIAALKQSGREFTTDSAGRIIPIRTADYRAATGTRNIDLHTDIEEERIARARMEEARLAAEQPKRNTSSSFARKKKQKQTHLKVVPGSWIKPDDNNGPMVDDMKPGAGIMYRTEDSAQRNDFKPSVGKMTRGDFKKHSDAQDVAANMLGEDFYTFHPLDSSRTTSSQQTTRAALEHKKGHADTKFTDSAAGIPSIPPLMVSNEPLPSAALAVHHDTTVTQVVPVVNPPLFKPQPAAALPTEVKHGVQGYSSVLGQRAHFPKERPFVHRRVVDNPSEHLPPPVYPAYRGHGESH